MCEVWSSSILLLLCLCLTSHQQIRSCGDCVTALGLIPQTGEAGNRTCDPWFTRQVAYPQHRSGSYDFHYTCSISMPDFKTALNYHVLREVKGFPYILSLVYFMHTFTVSIMCDKTWCMMYYQIGLKKIDQFKTFTLKQGISTKLTLKAPITTAADDKFCKIFPSFRQK